MRTIGAVIGLFVYTFISFGCTSVPAVNTNLDKENFHDYFSVSQVTVYQKHTLPTSATYIGLVEGNSCKLNSNDKPANDSDARTVARAQAAKLGAQGVVFSACTEVADNQCLQMKVCYAQAYRIK
ncbi:Rcs stress response system protein RcsF [Thalassotalea maritima]|uniref:Rcs stress response system protein RcsF n=1 Tax=Thalassotalea maritima TaxID=3242416 RepID=UPI0035298BD0